MTLLRTLNNAVTGLNTISDHFGVISDNISNADNKNYHRRVLHTEDDVNSGVRVSGIVRQTNDAMQKAYRTALARSEASTVRNAVYTDISSVLGSSTGNSRLTSVLNSFTSAWRELQSAPENEAVAFKIEEAAKELASLIRSVAQEAELMRQEVNTDIANSVTRLNSFITQFETLNGQVIAQPESSSARSAYENQRDEVLDEISKIMDISVQKNADGTLSVYSKTGITLFSGYANQFQWDSTNQVLTSDLTSRNLTSELPDGSLKAQYLLIKNYNDGSAGSVEANDPNISPLHKIREQLDSLVKALTKPSDPANPITLAGAFAGAFSPAVAYPGDNIPGASPYQAYWQRQMFVPGEKLTSDNTSISALNFYVNDNLVPNIRSLARDANRVNKIVTNLSSRTRDVDLKSMKLTNQNYEGISKAIQVNFSVRNERINALYKTNTSTLSKVNSNYRSAVGVSLDEEMARITMLQNSYVASAKIITTVNNMFTTLEKVV